MRRAAMAECRQLMAQDLAVYQEILHQGLRDPYGEHLKGKRTNNRKGKVRS